MTFQAAILCFFQEFLNGTLANVTRVWTGTTKPIQKSLLLGLDGKRGPIWATHASVLTRLTEFTLVANLWLFRVRLVEPMARGVRQV